jgi:hypothetical protein
MPRGPGGSTSGKRNLFARTHALLLPYAWIKTLLCAVVACALIAIATPAGADAPRLDSPQLGALEARPMPVPKGFNTYEGGWIQFHYHPSFREHVQPLIREADSVRHDLVAHLGQSVLDDVRVYVARTPGEMAALAPEGAPFPEYASGVAYSQLGLILLTIAPVTANAHHDLAQIFRHELAHVALHDAVAGRPIPRWFNEGFAVYASGESSLIRLQTLWTATLADRLLPLQDLERLFPADTTDVSIAYAEAADVLRFLVRRQDRHRFANMIGRVRTGQDFERALQDAYGTDLRTLEFDWREDVGKRYSFWPVLVSGTVVWVSIFGLFLAGWRRRRQRDQETMARWAREEAAEEELQRRTLMRESAARVHIVLAPQRIPPQELRPSVPEAEIPKVEHDGQWHTLH